MIVLIITGGAGFIGSNLVKALNNQGRHDIVVVDHLHDGKKFQNLADCEIADYLDRDDLETYLTKHGSPDNIEALIHQGACTSTTQWDGQYMMRNNYEYSKQLLHYALRHRIPLIYASSAAVYGKGPIFKEEREYEHPLNVYGYSKFLFDQYVRRELPQANSQIVGLRYFNVYGPREFHKGPMSSIALQLYQQLHTTGKLKLFAGSEGYADGGQVRDFVYVEDVAKVICWFLQHPQQSGIFNVGTGKCQSFNDVARTVISYFGRGTLEYIPFPEQLKGHYQSHTEADISLLRTVGYGESFCPVEEGGRRYMEWLAKHPHV